MNLRNRERLSGQALSAMPERKLLSRGARAPDEENPPDQTRRKESSRSTHDLPVLN